MPSSLKGASTSTKLPTLSMKLTQTITVTRESISKTHYRYPTVRGGMRGYPSIPGTFIQSRRPTWYAVVCDGA